MPRHIRNNLMNGLQMALDRTWEFQELERLTENEKKSVIFLRSDLMKLQSSFGVMVGILEERGDFQPPERIEGSMFSWAMHDVKAIAKRPKKKFTREQLENKLAKLTAKLQELQDESE